MIIEIEVPILDTNDEYEEITVSFEGEPEWENDSYDDEFGTVKKDSYPSMAMNGDVKWDKTKYTSEINEKIENWYKIHIDYVEGKFCRQLEKQSDPGY